MKTKTLVSIAVFCAIFGLAYGLRQFTFWLPHWQGDQSQYVMAAMKLGTSSGLDYSQYNLSGIDTETIDISSPPKTEVIFPHRTGGPGRGFVLDVYYRQGLAWYDTPLFYKPPLLPLMLSWTHRWFAERDQPFSVVKSNLGSAVQRVRPKILLKAQFWAAVVPFAASLITLLLIYVWARREFGEEPALIASFIYAVNPISILTSNRLWTEDLLLVFLTAAMWVYRIGFRRRRGWVCFGSGILLGLSALANPRALLAVGVVGLYTLLALRGDRKKWIQIFIDARGWLFLAGYALTTAHWYWTSTRYLGSPSWQPEVVMRMLYGRDITSIGGTANIQAWYRVLLSQPHGLIYYPIGTAAICWGFVAGYCSIARGWTAVRRAWIGANFDDRYLLLWMWIFVYAVCFLTHRTGEYRYLFAIYTPLCILSGVMLVRAGNVIERYMAHPYLAKLLVYCFLAGSAVYSIRLVQPVLWEQKNLIMAPWR